MLRKRFSTRIAATICVALAAGSLGAPSVSAQVALGGSAQSNGAGMSSSSNHMMLGILGQPIAGETARVRAGFAHTLETTMDPTDTEAQDPTLPVEYRLYQNYPNPFNPSTTVDFDLPESAFVRLVVFDMLGRVVESLVTGRQSPGTHTVRWDAGDHPSGVYFYQIEAGDFVQTRKMILMR